MDQDYNELSNDFKLKFREKIWEIREWPEYNGANNTIRSPYMALLISFAKA